MQLTKQELNSIVVHLDTSKAPRVGYGHAAYCAAQRVIFATDGHRLAVVREAKPEPKKPLAWDLASIYPIPVAVLTAAAKGLRAKESARIEAHPTGVEIVAGGLTLAVPRLDAAMFPPMVQVLEASNWDPRKGGTPSFVIDSKYLADALELVGPKAIVRVSPSDLDPVLIESPGGRISALVMPMRA